ncbi:TldD/PmbA family protein, partial [Candidatus Bathyarchaeota archaeon]
GGNRQSAHEVRGRLEGYELIKGLKPEDISVKAAEKAVSLLSAKAAPAGKFTAILDPAVVGLLAHEAFGHNSEADHVISGESIIAGMVGKRVASPLVTLLDDPTVKGAYGSYRYDSEGTPGVRKVLIEDGILKGYLHSLETAAMMGVEPNGSARAIEHLHQPLVRMSNTYIKPGDWTLDEMLEDTREGVYLKGGYWGYVFTERGQFACNVEEGYTIRNGELFEHIRNVSFGGLTLETLKNIDAVSRDFELKLPGMCGKGGQAMYVDGGGPHVRVKEVILGGQR